MWINASFPILFHAMACFIDFSQAHGRTPSENQSLVEVCGNTLDEKSFQSDMDNEPKKREPNHWAEPHPFAHLFQPSRLKITEVSAGYH